MIRVGASVALLVALGAACDNRSDVYLGGVWNTRGGNGGSGGSSAGSGGLCDLSSLEKAGTRVFLLPSAPADASTTFAAAACQPPGSDAAREPHILYPSDETKLPSNSSSIRFEWSSSPDDALYQLELRGAAQSVVVYTAEPAFELRSEVWAAAVVAAGSPASLSVFVRALGRKQPARAFESVRRSLFVGGALPDVPIYYWSTTARGILRARFDGATPPVRLASNTPESQGCVGCHALSRDGKRLAFDADSGHLSIEDVSALMPASGVGGAGPMPGKMMDKLGAEAPAAWSAFSPDGSRIALATNGTLSVLDANGAPLGPDKGALMLPAKSVAAHPDWSPEGDRLIFTLGEKGGGRSVEKGQIASVSYTADRFGPVEVLVTNEGADDNNVFPSVSPDGKFVAFVNTHAKSYDSAAAELRLLRLEDAHVFPLTRLNSRVNAQDGLSSLGNSMPTWLSSLDGALWLSFSSLRAYASVREQNPKLDQLWLAAVDPELEDPGLAAFWAPFQRLEHGNHRAIWAMAGTASSCGCQEICGDGADNDCDGSTDEAECVASCDVAEVCGDGVDNDCDCVIDDCAGEDCADNVDNDGDGAIDAADALCKK